VNHEINNNFEKHKTNNIKKIIFENYLSLNEINFKYENTEEKILNNLNLNIKKNSIIGIFGESGSGKSTLVDIVSGLLKPNSGNIKIDDKIFDSVDLLNTNLIGYVSQNTFFIDDTVKKNIAFGLNDEEIDFVKLDKAIREAKLDDFVQNLESGLDTIIGERGMKISGGQRQRICIARALYFDSPILIFDEATNALDSQTELEILETIFSVKDKTMIIIAHHFTEWSNCDKIYKLENKTLVEKNDFKFN
jgi:ABC-type multidrug transport system fused ATPase/permease subunit